MLQEWSEVLAEEYRLRRTDERRQNPLPHVSPRASTAKQRAHERHGAVLGTGLTEAVRLALPSLPKGTWDVHGVVRIMTVNGYEFANNNPTSAVGGVLRKLEGKGEVTLVTKGVGGEASQYARE